MRASDKKSPTPRKEVYDLYWYFAVERHAAFEARYLDKPGPWSDDPILQSYKFCNTFRALDRVSQYMIREVCYGDQTRTPADVLFQIVAFRMFSRIETWDAIKQYIGRAPSLADLADGSFERALQSIKNTGSPLYTGAFIICANDAFGYGSKHLNHAALFAKMFLVDDVAAKLLSAESLKQVYDILHSYPLYGDFMSYQTAIDLNYGEYINFSENDFTVPGPGAMRGIKKAFVDLGDYTPAETIMWMVERQDEEFKRLGLHFSGLWGRKIHAIDAQSLFCELDKYTRVKLPELTSNRKQIKAKFKPKPPIAEIFLPPKWYINIPNR